MDFLDSCVQMMPKGERIGYYRSDIAAYQAGVMNYCFGHDLLFTSTRQCYLLQNRGYYRLQSLPSLEAAGAAGVVANLHHSHGKTEALLGGRKACVLCPPSAAQAGDFCRQSHPIQAVLPQVSPGRLRVVADKLGQELEGAGSWAESVGYVQRNLSGR